jgi:predicted acylesterase/phospholipase RssA
MGVSEIKALCEKMLTRRDLLDKSWWPLDRWGIYKGDAIYKLLGETFGDRRMKDLVLPCRVVVCDLWTRRAVSVGRDSHPDVLVKDAARCTMAIPIFFRAARLEPNNARLYVDGGTTDNFPHGLFDDYPSPTVGIRFADQDDAEPVPVRGVDDYAAALFDLRMDAANLSHPSRKQGSEVIRIETKSDGLKFGLDLNEVRARWEDGRRSAEKWISAR